MLKNTSITPSPHFEGFITRQIAIGRFDLEEQEIHLAALRQALEDGEASGRTDYALAHLIEELDETSVS
ncbi:MAG: type II toxin-antitoxin system ParD family antitoxin [Magnetococcales bacterium]|nr:type II toxin-antitoxin system ParD family antitoxin [Magnetococcales bacterium]